MNKRNHSKFRRLIQLAADGRLNTSQQQALEAHLEDCAECRLYAAEVQALETQLASVSITRLVPSTPGQQTSVAAIRYRYRRYQMNRQILSTIGMLVTLVVVAVSFFLFGRLVPRQSSPVAGPQATAPDEIPILTISTKAISIPAAVSTPTWLPEGYTYFNSKTLDNDQTTCLYFLGDGDDAQFPSLVIAQSRHGLPSIEQIRDPLYNEMGLDGTKIPLITETIHLGGAVGAQALFIESGMDPSQLCGGDRVFMDQALMWQANHASFALFSRRDNWMGAAFLTRLEMRRVAENMTGVSTIAADTIDPERMTDLRTAKAIAGFNFKNPAYIPGLSGKYGFDYAPFNYISFEQYGSVRQIVISYPGELWSEVIFGTTRTLESFAALAPGFYETVLVNSHPGLFSPGICWDENDKPFTVNCGAEQTLIWFEDNLEYMIGGFRRKDVLLEIANSMIYTDLTLDQTMAAATLATQNQPLHFFTRAESDQLSLQPWQLTPLPETPTPDPGWIFNLSITEAEQLAGFDVLEPNGFPGLLNFKAASYDPLRNIVRLFYTTGFVLRQEQTKINEDCELCGVVGASAVVDTVKIGDVPGEYVVGVWNLTANGPVWESDPFMKTLRWQVNGMAFELMYNPSHDPDAVTEADLIAIAESLASENSRTILKTSIGEFAYISARLVDEIPEVKYKANPGSKILLVVFSYSDGRMITSDELDLNDFDAAQREAGVYILGDGGSPITNPGAGFMLDGFVMVFMVPDSLTSYQLIWPGNDPIEIIPEQAAEHIDQPTIADAEIQVGYPLNTLTSLPAGYVFSQVDVHQLTNSVCLVYEYTGNDGPGPELWLAQGPIDTAPELVSYPGFSETRQTPVAVGGAQEAYSLYGMAREGEWGCVRPQGGYNPYLVLTWQVDGQQYDLYAGLGKCLLEEGLSDLGLLRLAEETTGVSTHAADEFDPQCTTDIAAVEALAGFQNLLPQAIPGGLEFYGASYSGGPANIIGLYYRLPGSNHTGLVIQQMPVNPELGNDLASQYRDLPVEGYQLLTIAGNPAVIILGDWVISEGGEKVWYQVPGFAPTLWLERDGLLIAISGPWLADADVDPQEILIAIAESLR